MNNFVPPVMNHIPAMSIGMGMVQLLSRESTHGQGKSLMFHILWELNDKLNITRQIHNLPEELKTSTELLLSSTPEKVLEIIDSESSHPGLKSFALIYLLEQKLYSHAAVLLDTYDFEKSDDYVIVKSLMACDFAIIEFLVDSGFSYTARNINPFVIIVKIINMGFIVIDKNLPHEAIKIFDLFIKLGYDIHMQNDLAFKNCVTIELLKYFIEIGTDVRACGRDWMLNFKDKSVPNCQDVFKLLITNGLDTDMATITLFDYSLSNLDIDIMRTLDKQNINFKEYEILISRIGQHGFAGNIYDREILKILHKHGCNLNLISYKYLNYLIRQYRYEALEFLYENGVDIQKILNSASEQFGNTQDDEPRYETFKILEKYGMPMQKIIQMI